MAAIAFQPVAVSLVFSRCCSQRSLTSCVCMVHTREARGFSCARLGTAGLAVIAPRLTTSLRVVWAASCVLSGLSTLWYAVVKTACLWIRSPVICDAPRSSPSGCGALCVRASRLLSVPFRVVALLVSSRVRSSVQCGAAVWIDCAQIKVSMSAVEMGRNRGVPPALCARYTAGLSQPVYGGLWNARRCPSRLIVLPDVAARLVMTFPLLRGAQLSKSRMRSPLRHSVVGEDKGGRTGL